jgi:hypothetical protein
VTRHPARLIAKIRAGCVTGLARLKRGRKHSAGKAESPIYPAHFPLNFLRTMSIFKYAIRTSLESVSQQNARCAKTWVAIESGLDAIK